jgi:hypothetical protein
MGNNRASENNRRRPQIRIGSSTGPAYFVLLETISRFHGSSVSLGGCPSARSKRIARGLVFALLRSFARLTKLAMKLRLMTWFSPVDFSETGYYTKTMGEGLQKQLLAFSDLIQQDEVVESKLQSNAWEDEFKSSGQWEEDRPVNLDPGYLTEAKLVLATTKDRDHRIYLSRGIFAEVTLFYQGNDWQSSRWTYPDYQRPDFHEFYDRCREHLRKRYAIGDFVPKSH